MKAALRFVCLATVLTSALLLAACSDKSTGDDDGLTSIQIVNQAGKTATIRVEIADTFEKGTKGLSGRESLAADNGMLFLMPSMPGFWMVDTLIPLSAAFINSCGEIVAIAEMTPLSPKVHNTRQPYAFGLEANGGWFDAHGIGVGAKVKLPAQYQTPGCG